ncbi:MAG: hypothetical protein KA408_05515 [Flavobacteriales bacterium]|nr:hypothetical protein [Flavobacteriales bacterium]
MKRPVIFSLLVVFILGVMFMLMASTHYETLPIVVRNVQDTLVVDSVFCIGEKFRVSPPQDVTSKNDEIKWRLDSSQYDVEAVREFSHLAEGVHRLDMLINGRYRGTRNITVRQCNAVIQIPNSMVVNVEATFSDKTTNARSRHWYINGDDITVDSIATDLTYKFSTADVYNMEVQVITNDGDTLPIYSSEIVVYPPQKKVERKVPLVVTPTEKLPKVEKEKVVAPPAEIPGPVTSNGFLNKASYEFSKVHVVSYVDDAEESCFDYNGERSTLNLKDLKKDVCLSKIWVVPDPDLKGNKLLVRIKNAKSDFEWAQNVFPVQGGFSDGPRYISITTLGCALLKGESYIITVQSADEESRFADMSYANDCLGLIDIGDLMGGLDFVEKTKIVKLEFRY